MLINYLGLYIRVSFSCHCSLVRYQPTNIKDVLPYQLGVNRLVGFNGLMGFSGPSVDDRLLCNHLCQLGINWLVGFNRPLGFSGSSELQWLDRL